MLVSYVCHLKGPKPSLYRNLLAHNICPNFNQAFRSSHCFPRDICLNRSQNRPPKSASMFVAPYIWEIRSRSSQGTHGLSRYGIHTNNKEAARPGSVWWSIVGIARCFEQSVPIPSKPSQSQLALLLPRELFYSVEEHRSATQLITKVLGEGALLIKCLPVNRNPRDNCALQVVRTAKCALSQLSFYYTTLLGAFAVLFWHADTSQKSVRLQKAVIFEEVNTPRSSQLAV